MQAISGGQMKTATIKAAATSMVKMMSDAIRRKHPAATPKSCFDSPINNCECDLENHFYKKYERCYM